VDRLGEATGVNPGVPRRAAYGDYTRTALAGAANAATRFPVFRGLGFRYTGSADDLGQPEISGRGELVSHSFYLCLLTKVEHYWRPLSLFPKLGNSLQPPAAFEYFGQRVFVEYAGKFVDKNLDML
jgi:hypothetical protein